MLRYGIFSAWSLNLKRKVKTVKRFSFLLIILFLVASVFAANTDRFYQGTVTIEESFTSVTYKWVYTVPAEATDQMHSPAIFIGDMNDADGMVTTLVDAASDINIVYYFGTGPSWYTAVTPADLDAISNSTVTDTIGIEVGTTSYAFDMGTWLIIQADGGSAACTAGETVIIVITLRKDKYFIDSSGRMVDCGKVRTRRSYGWTNP